MGRHPATLGVLALALALGGCGSKRRGPGPATTTAGVSSAAAPQPTPGLLLQLGRACAPQLRFNAWVNDGNTARQNRHEDFFPMGVASFLAELASGQARVLVQGSAGAQPGASEVRAFAGSPRFGASDLGGYPRAMVGDPPGTAPLYLHAYLDPAASQLAPDGSGEQVAHLEYWVFFAYDRSEAKLLGWIPTSGADLTGHRADWEHTSWRVRARLGPGGALLGVELEQGTFYGHNHSYRVPGPDLERVNDQGQPDPQGTHPVVYVSQGKHASYPQAGEWRGSSVPTWLAEHTDFFRGNGVVIDGWRVPLLDLEDPTGDPAAFAPPALATLLASSPLAPGLLPDWTAYWGHWGPDLQLALGQGGLLGLSPTGPRFKPSYGDFGGSGPDWAATKARQAGNLRAYRDLGLSFPTLQPPPAPLRR